VHPHPSARGGKDLFKDLSYGWRRSPLGRRPPARQRASTLEGSLPRHERRQPRLRVAKGIIVPRAPEWPRALARVELPLQARVGCLTLGRYLHAQFNAEAEVSAKLDCANFHSPSEIDKPFGVNEAKFLALTEWHRQRYSKAGSGH
jgi:hypothetical protein